MGLKELNERRKLQLRNKAIKKGLDPEAFCGAHPPRIHMFSKYERRTDTRTYGDRKKLYEGGAEIIRSEWLEAVGRRSSESGTRDPRPSCPSGAVSVLARRREIQRPPRARRRGLKPRLRKSMRKGRRTMRRR